MHGHRNVKVPHKSLWAHHSRLVNPQKAASRQLPLFKLHCQTVGIQYGTPIACGVVPRNKNWPTARALAYRQTDGTANLDFGAGGNANAVISYKRRHCGISGCEIVDYFRVS
jgi:hypothetical protein